MPVHHSRAWFALALLVALMVPGVAVAETTRPAPIGQDPFRPGHTYRGDFPDPTVIYTQGKYYAYSTTTAHLNLPVLVSSDARTWTATGPTKRLRAGLGPDALPKLPTWAWHDAHGLGTVWAPSVAHWDGRYVVAYAVRKWGHAHKMCISTAVSSSPRGPFVDHTTKPLVCPYNRGAIDPMLYHENGHNYLLYKTEDISIGRPTRIWIRRVTHSGRATTADPPHRLLTANQPWEERTVEGPGMITYAGKRYLFYSAGGWPQWAVGAFFAGLGVLGVTWTVWTLDLLRALARRYSLGGALAWPTLRGASGPETPPFVLVTTASLTPLPESSSSASSAPG